MESFEPKKLALIRIWQILKDYSDYEHPLTQEDMYTDYPEYIDFIADIGIIDQIIDWFGSDIRITKTDDKSKVRVIVKASPNAMVSWLYQHESGMVYPCKRGKYYKKDFSYFSIIKYILLPKSP